MAVAVTMPRQGQSVESCIITKWFATKGDKTKSGEILFSYETDKASFDMESPSDGVLLAVFFGEGDEVPVLSTVAVIGTEGEDISSFLPSAGAHDKQNVSLKETVSSKQIVKTQSTEKSSLLRISPRARRMAASAGVQFDSLKGSGPNGRIVVSDIERAKSSGASEVSDGAPFTDIGLSNVRKIISKAMLSSLRDSAQLTHHMSADARKILHARKIVKEALSKGIKRTDITLNDIICYCVIQALGKHKEINSHFLGETLRVFNEVNLGIAVDTPRGLMVPAVPMAGKMKIEELSSALSSVAEACRKGSADPEKLKSTAASFTISNLGNYGVEMFTPVLNLPQVAILGVCTITYRPADTGDGTIGFIPVIGLSLTYDHRAVDGGPATLFLREIKNEIETFELK